MKNAPLNHLITGTLIACMVIGCSKSSTPANHPAPAPAITSVIPSHGPDSTQVIISGTGFSDTLANDAVFFNGKQATVLSVTSTTITARLPTLAGTGNVTVTVDGNTLNGGVFTYDTTWRVTTIVDNLQFPSYLSVDANANLYVPTYGNGVINKISPQGAMTTFANAPCFGNVLDASGDLYVAENKSDSTYIIKYSPAGTPTFIAADSGSLYSLALDKNGNIYASNNTKNTVDKITPQGTVSVLVGNLYTVSGIAVAGDGSIYVSNYSTPGYTPANGVLTKISPLGVASTVTKLLYAGESGIAIDAQGNIFATVFNPGQELGSVMRITPSGTITTLTSANLQAPAGIAVDSNGNLYVVQQVDAPTSAVGSVVKMVPH